MNNRIKTFTAITAALLLIGGAISQQTRQNTESRLSTNIQANLIYTDPVPVQAGEDADITFKLRNTGNTQAEGVEVHLVDSFPFKVKPDRQVNYSLGSMTPGQEYQISTEVLVAENAPDGMNSFKVKISYGDFSVIKEVPIQVQSQDIELNLANLQTSPTSLTPDIEDAKMTLEVVNDGEKIAENVVTRIDIPEDFQATSSFSTRQSLGNLEPGQVKKAEFTFDIEEDAKAGEVRIPTNITYSTDSKPSTSRITEKSDFSFYLAAKPQFRVEDVESNLATGETRELRIKVRNVGGVKSSSTRIRVLDSSDQPFSYASSSKYIGTLEPNQTGTAVFEIDTEASAPVKDYLIDFEIRGVKDTQTYVEDVTVEASVEPGSKKTGFPVLPVVAGIFALGVLYYWLSRGDSEEQEE